MLSITRKIIEIDEFGAAIPDITPEELEQYGIDFGDTLDFRFSNGAILENVPYYNGFYCKTGDPLFVAYPTFTHPAVNINADDFSKHSGVTAGDTVTITMNQKGAKKDVMDLRGVVYSNDPKTYSSPDQFANAREFRVGKIVPGKVYRCASPFDRMMNRPDAVSSFLQEHAVRSTLSLSETDETLRKRYSEMPDYSREIYESGHVVPIRLGADYFSDTLKTKLTEGLIRIMEEPQPWAIHCMEGKDRTGFVCVMLGALMDAGYRELVDDFMKTFENYYGITKETDAFRYEGFKSTFVDTYLRIFAGLSDGEDPAGHSYRKGAEDYLRSGGMSDEQIEKLKSLLQ